MNVKQTFCPPVPVIAIALVVFLCFPLVAAANDEPRTIKAVKTDPAPTMDGSLEDAAWNAATPIATFYQREPFEKQPATEKTEVKVLYDRHYLYFGIRCYDSEPNKIVATELRRDADYSVDDNFSILLSPSNDKRSGYTFTFNPLGTQFDALLSDEGRVDDPNWDGIWQSYLRIYGLERVSEAGELTGLQDI